MINEDFIKAVESELQYQQSIQGVEDHMNEDLSMGDFLNAIDVILRRAKDKWYYDSHPYEKTMDEIRKISAMTAVASEKYDMPKRKNND